MYVLLIGILVWVLLQVVQEILNSLLKFGSQKADNV